MSFMRKKPIVRDAIYNAKEATNLLGIHRQTLLRKVHAGLIPAKFIGNKYLILGEDLLNFIKSK